MRKIIFVVLSCLVLAACGSKKKANNYNKRATTQNSSQKVTEVKKPVTPPTPEAPVKEILDDEKVTEAKPVFKDNVEEYIYNFSTIAKEEMRLYGIPASITLAQGVLESSAGKGDLTLRSNNHFGIKCNGWQGDKVYHDDDAYQECFRKYNDAKYSFRDHSLFLTGRRRYSKLFELDKDDYKGWAYGLKKAGYATDPRYPVKLIGIIERYELYTYDDEVLGNASRKGKPSTELKADKNSRYTVKKGDTLYSISQKNGLSVEELKQMNNLRSNNISIGQKLYVKTK